MTETPNSAVSRIRNISPLSAVLNLLIIAFWLAIFRYALTFNISRPKLSILFIGFAVSIYVLSEIKDLLAENDVNKLELLGMTGALLIGVVASSYFYFLFDTIYRDRVGFASQMDMVFAIPLFLTIMGLTYREFGVPFVAVVGGTLFYAYFGYMIPGVFGHAGLGFNRIVQVSVTDITGIFGSLTQIMAAWIALFFLFAGLMQGYGAFDIIMRGAVKLSSKVSSGVALTAVIGSSIMGSINGSSTANTGITGSITIPLMKENGMKPSSAAAIEAVASNGGQIMPPIMGATAFVMASLLARPFSDILIAGIIPAVIYFICIGFAVHFTAVRELELNNFSEDDMQVDVDNEERSDLLGSQEYTKSELVMETIRFGLPVVLLIYYLAIAQYTLITSAFRASLFLFATGIGFPILYYRSWESVLDVISDTMEGLFIGATLTASVGIVIAALNVVADVLLTTGVPSKLTLALMEIAGGVMFIAIFLAVVMCIILGMGMPTIAAYLIVALLVSPAIINNFGVPELTTHYFVFYAANLSTITPPIAASVIVATGIAGSNFWRTSVQAVRLSAPIFVFPFTFIYNPGIISPTMNFEVIYLGILTLVGALSLIYGLNYPRNIKRGRIVQTIFVLAGLVIMIHPNIMLSLSLIVVSVGLFMIQQLYLTTKQPIPSN
jgi:TRAP transporter 4TM/12TM fusion protein